MRVTSGATPLRVLRRHALRSEWPFIINIITKVATCTTRSDEQVLCSDREDERRCRSPASQQQTADNQLTGQIPRLQRVAIPTVVEIFHILRLG